LQAAILRVKLKYLAKWSKERAKKANYYSKNLKNIEGVVVPKIGSNRTHIFHQYTIKAKFRDKLQKYLKERGVPTMVYYPLSLHLQPALKDLKYKKGDFPKAEKIAGEVLSLPIYPEIKKKDQDYIIREIDFLE
jgi:dTDP-4-amino-4,6-dideoxygalactose transaminase